MNRGAVLLACLVICGATAAMPAQAKSAAKSQLLRAGVGQADITPPKTGYFLGGWTRADRLALGQSTRLFANTVVLQRGTRKVALVAVELFSISAGLQEDVARSVADLGYDKETILMSASHTHSGPGGFTNNPLYNTAAPSPETLDDPASFVRFFDAPPADRQLYTFLVKQIAMSIRRADADRAPAVAAWGHTKLVGITQNRSIEAHLRDHGIDVPFGQGTVAMDPLGYEDTIDPSIDVLRVDKLVKRKGHTVHMPIGAWSNFADHGTVVHSELQAYSGDHHATAWRTLVADIRKAGHVPASQTVVDAYPNSDEGDQTAGIARYGPAAANYVGLAEAGAMFDAWKRAGKHMSKRPVIDFRWTRQCFCGRPTADGPVASSGLEGVPFLTGSEEGRGPLYDITGVAFEGLTSPLPSADQGDKLGAPLGTPPPAIPLSVWRIGDEAIATVPAEPTKETGTRIKAAVMQKLSGDGVHGVVIAGLAYDYLQYVTTPQEYAAQSYEGGSTLFGPNEEPFIQEQLAGLAGDLASGAPAPPIYPLDTSYGVKPDGAPYPPGAATGAITAQPQSSYERLGHATLGWTGGANGADRPVDAAFVHAQRKTRSGWRDAETDLGLTFLWRVDSSGHYTATWEVPLSEPVGTYRFVVTATRYRLVSNSFAVKPSTALTITEAATGEGAAGVRLSYPAARPDIDLTSRPASASGGTVRFTVGTRQVTERRANATVFSVPGATGTPVSIAAGAATDRWDNTNGSAAAVG